MSSLKKTFNPFSKGGLGNTAVLGLGGPGGFALFQSVKKAFDVKNNSPPETPSIPDAVDAEAAAEALRRRLAARQGRQATQTGALDLAPSMNTGGMSTTTGGGP